MRVELPKRHKPVEPSRVERPLRSAPVHHFRYLHCDRRAEHELNRAVLPPGSDRVRCDGPRDGLCVGSQLAAAIVPDTAGLVRHLWLLELSESLRFSPCRWQWSLLRGELVFILSLAAEHVSHHTDHDAVTQDPNAATCVGTATTGQSTSCQADTLLVVAKATDTQGTCTQVESVCPTGYSRTNSNKCIPTASCSDTHPCCSTGASACTDDKTATACAASDTTTFFLTTDHTCVATCPNGLVGDTANHVCCPLGASSCVSPTAATVCTSPFLYSLSSAGASSGVCAKTCQNGFVLSLHKTGCVATCRTNQVASGSGSCRCEANFFPLVDSALGTYCAADCITEAQLHYNYFYGWSQSPYPYPAHTDLAQCRTDCQRASPATVAYAGVWVPENDFFYCFCQLPGYTFPSGAGTPPDACNMLDLNGRNGGSHVPNAQTSALWVYTTGSTAAYDGLACDAPLALAASGACVDPTTYTGCDNPQPADITADNRICCPLGANTCIDPLTATS